MAFEPDPFDFSTQFQPIAGAPDITLAALSFTPDYKGFNLNSLSRKDLPEFKSDNDTIGMETALWGRYKALYGNNDHDKYENWRATQFQNWSTSPNGFKFPDVKYP